MNVNDHYTNSFNDNEEWFEFYGDAKEDTPKNVSRELVKGVEVTAWVHADHAGYKLTRRSHTRLLIFVYSAPIVWYSKRQATIESYTFGPGVVAIRKCLELVKAL